MYVNKVSFSYRVVSLCSVRSFKNNSTKKLLEFLADMPKANSARIAEAQRQRQQITKRSEKYAPSTVYLQVIGSGARGAPNTLYMFTDQKRYLFNCGECTQRLAHEHKVKLSRLDHIFITSKTWKNIGGLPGLSLTLQDVGVPNITLHGPEGLDELYNATRRFVIMKDMNVTMAKCSPIEDFEDSVMSVKYVLLGPHDSLLAGKDLKPAAKRPKLEPNQDKEFEEFIHDETDYYKPEAKNNNSKNKNSRDNRVKLKGSPERDPIKNKKTEKVLHDLHKKTNSTVAYICTLKKRLGTLDLAKCVEMGVKPGPLLGQLKSGLDVVLPDGTLVLSKDVKTPDDPGPVFIVIEVPELSYLKEAEFSAHFDNGVNPRENIPTLIVHYTPPEVMQHPTYRAFMSLFGTTTQHLVLNSQSSCLGSEAVHRTQHKLHLLDPDIFPLLRDASIPAVWNSQPPLPKTDSPVRLKGLEELKNKFQNIVNMEGSCKGDGGQGHATGDEEQSKIEAITGRTLTMFHLRPKRQLDRSAEPKLHVQEYIQETMDVDGLVGSLEQFRGQVDSLRYRKAECKEYPKVVFLGTGSCIPSKTRNTSGMALQIDENRSMLLDCGEGTLGQLVRFYGARKVSGFLRTLKAIYVSHLHADHHIGLIGVLLARRQAWQEVKAEGPLEPLYLLAPGQIYTWLSTYDQQFERIRGDFTLIPNQNLMKESHKQNADMVATLANIGVERIRTCLVSHCPNAFGVAIDVDANHRITYSGDTIPCEELVNIGQNSHLLIHEATMEDELEDEARTKMHSTTSQAIEMGKKMNARYTVLTHFSQRYARLPRLSAHILNDNKSVGIAFDNMQITMGDLDLLPHMYAPLQLMFAEHCVEMELKAAHRARQKERASSPNYVGGGMRTYSTSSARADADNADKTPPNADTVAANADATPANADTEMLAADKTDDAPAKKQETIHNDKVSPRSRSSSRSHSHKAPCLATASAPAPRATYRESHASRLRQEIKGMTVSGTVRPGPRSKSASPRKAATQPNTRTNSNCPTPKERRLSDTSPDKTLAKTAARLQNTTTKNCGGRLDESPQKSLQLIASTPRSMSATSNMSKGTPERLKPITANASPGSVVDTRSKTSNTAKCQPASEDSMRNHGRKNTKSNVPPNGGNRPRWMVKNNTLKESTILRPVVGYGKPLVTNITKRLTIMRELPTPLSNVKNSRSVTNRGKSPAKPLRTDSKDSVSSVPGRKFDLMKSKFPTKGATENKARTSNTVPKINPEETVAMMKSPVTSKQLRRSSAPVNKHRSPIRTEEEDILKSRAKYMKTPPSQKKNRSWCPGAYHSPNKPPSKDRLSVSSSPTKSLQDGAKSNKKDLTGVNKPSRIPRSISDIKPQNTERKKEEKKPLIMDPLRDILNERLKQHSNLCKDVPISVIARQSSGMHSRSFKPQLEDIKSSYMLLNKQSQEQNNKSKMEKANKNELVSVQKPKPFSEEIRVQQLMNARQKFKSKSFWNDSKYDKIEGLNWISWK